jgi:glutaredoxin
VFCDKVKEFLSRRGVPYTERDVTQDDAALDELEKLGVFSTPVTVVDGDVVIGFDRVKLEQIFAE